MIKPNKNIDFDTSDGLLMEAQNRIMYQYLQTDGTIKFPNSFDGDILKLVWEAAEKRKHENG